MKGLTRFFGGMAAFLGLLAYEANSILAGIPDPTLKDTVGNMGFAVMFLLAAVVSALSAPVAIVVLAGGMIGFLVAGMVTTISAVAWFLVLILYLVEMDDS